MRGAVAMIARAQGRRRWRAALALTLFVGLAGGLATALVAGARRSSTVVDRFFSVQNEYQASIGTQPWGPTRSQVRSLPGVLRADPAAYVAMSVEQPDGTLVGSNGQALDFARLDPTIRIVDGTLPGPDDPTGVAVNPAFVAEHGVGVGDTVHVRMFGPDQGDAVSAGVYEPEGPGYTFRIRAVVRTPDDLATNEARSPVAGAYASESVIAVQDAWYQAHRRDFLDFPGVFNVQLRPGTARSAVHDALVALTPDGADAGFVLPPQTTQRAEALDTPVRVETTSLLLLGIGVGLAAAITVTLVLRAEQRVHESESPVVRALGGTRHLLALVAVRRTLWVAVGGAVLTIVVAVALSGRFPIGIGRHLETDPGIRVDGLVVAAGGLVVLLVVLGAAYGFGRPRRARDAAPRHRRSVAGWLTGAGGPADAAIAAHLAFDRSPGGRRTPSRGAIVGGALLLAVVIGVGVYASGVDHVYTTPEAHGWAWDAAVGNTNFVLQPDTTARLARDDRVTARTNAEFGSATVDGEYAEFLVYDPRGTAPPEVLAGRLPVRAEEVALGESTLRKTGTRIGSTVELSFVAGDTGEQPDPQRFTVVGQALAPVFGDADVGDVGILSFAGARSLGAPTDPQLVLTRLASGRSAAGVAALDRDYTEEMATDMVPAKVVTIHRVRGVPLVGLVVAAVMALFVLVYALALSVRVRNRDLAILRALGLSARGVRRVLAWLGAIFATGIVVIGVPLGLVLGTAVWRPVARGIGVGASVHVDPLLWLVVPITFGVALAASWIPGRRAARREVTALLRAE